MPGGRSWTLGALEELLAVTDGLLPAFQRHDLEAARIRVAENRFNLVVLGEFKRGKSTLINALIGREILPAGVVPLTSVVTTIRGAERGERLVICYQDGRDEQHPAERIGEYVTERDNPGNGRGVERAVLELDHELLHVGLELVDTPGIGSIHSHNTQVARGFLPQVDAALFVLDAGQPLTEGERELFAEAAERVPRVLTVINKIDHLDDGDREEAVRFIAGALRDSLGVADIELFAVSARHGAGLGPLTDRLRSLAGGEREQLLLRSVAGLAKAAAKDGAQAARFEARAIELPLEELTARAALFERRIGELREATSEAGDLLDQGARRLVQERVNDPLGEHARVEAPRLRAELARRVEELGRPAPRELAADLERWIDHTVRRDFKELVPRFERQVADELSELEARYAGRVHRILEQVQEVAEDVFGAPAGEVLPEAGLQAPSRFSFKLKDVEHALDMIVGFGRTVTPGALGRRLVVRDAEQRLIEMTDRHAGRLALRDR
jgi:small GTP-binding protein